MSKIRLSKTERRDRLVQIEAMDATNERTRRRRGKYLYPEPWQNFYMRMSAELSSSGKTYDPEDLKLLGHLYKMAQRSDHYTRGDPRWLYEHPSLT